VVGFDLFFKHGSRSTAAVDAKNHKEVIEKALSFAVFFVGVGVILNELMGSVTFVLEGKCHENVRILFKISPLWQMIRLRQSPFAVSFLRLARFSALIQAGRLKWSVIRDVDYENFIGGR
ncbi:MAG: hypothetical protein IE937_12870, partial [Gammaproteobacteria bacterium]|nr:hypothetical protein [Gammaproteobacteria bacterium]